MDKVLLKPQKSDPGISFVIIAQSNIPGKSLNHINAFLWTSSSLVSHGLAFHSQCRWFSWTLLYKCYGECLFFCLEKTQSYFQSLTSASSNILDSLPPLVPPSQRGPGWIPAPFLLLSGLLTSPKIIFPSARIWHSPDQHFSSSRCDTLSPLVIIISFMPAFPTKIWASPGQKSWLTFSPPYPWCLNGAWMNK